METSSSASNDCGGAAAWKAEEAIAGNTEALQALRELISFPILYSRESRILGLKWPCGLLLYGPPGTGKTSLVRAVVRECDAHLIVISPHSVHRSHAGESEKNLREAFAEATSRAKSGKPSVIFIDEIDALCPRRDSRREQDIRIASQLFMLMDANKSLSTSGYHVVVVASTNRVDAIDPALRRAGRFDAEVEVSTPNEYERCQILKVLYVPPPDLEARREILRVHTRNMKVDGDVDLQQIAQDTELFTGAELEGLCREAGIVALREDISATVVCNRHFQTVMRSLRPALTREEIESYASFLKNPNLRPNILREPSSKLKSKGGNKSIFRSAAPVAVGAISLILYGVVKYISHQIDTTYTELART
ncbi:UNVERIFIED_CONTAM: Cell division control protein 48B [Sesamum radiatum]|uniref:Cell division control protein 48B n=1 Tax=Sesamum radiatum TaxID=300843 RepID=A0AAW2JQS6_SESRA